MLEILKYPDPRLKESSVPIKQFDSELHSFLDEMATTMYRSNGVGLAAPQVNKRVRLFVIDIKESDGGDGKLYEFINPKLSDYQGSTSFEEGCLSLPGITEKVKRAEWITIDYQDRKGNWQSLRAEGILSVAIQHENDHLDGKLFIDRLSPLKRKLIQKKIKKALLL